MKNREGEKVVGVILSRVQKGIMLSILALLLTVFPIPVFAVAEETDWKTIESVNFRVYCEKTSQGRKVLNRAKEAFDDIVADLDYRPRSKINIYVYNDHSLFLKESPVGVTTAYSQPFLNKIAISMAREPDLSTIDHEISHVVFLRSLPDTAHVPFWFVEGLAIFQSGPSQDISRAESELLERDISSIIDLSWEKPGDEKDQKENAIKGYSIIKYIDKEYGKETLLALIKDLQRGDDFYTALERNLQVSREELGKEWYDYKKAQSKQIYLQNLQHIGFFLIGLLTIAVTGVWFRTMWKRKRELDEEIEESGKEESGKEESEM